MDPARPLAIAGLVFAALLAAPGTARAETYRTCTGFIDTLPATIGTQGVWCLRRDLTTAIASGQAITIANNNVTIDCNGFKVGGQAAGAATQAQGIHADGRLNATVRNCNIRGFHEGVSFSGDGGGHLVEDNRLDGNTWRGITLKGDGSTVRRNHILDTGYGDNEEAYGIVADGTVDILDNAVVNLVPTGVAGQASTYGIVSYYNIGGVVSDNRVRGLLSQGTGDAWAIWLALGQQVTVLDNVVIGSGNSNSIGIFCNAGDRARDNVVNGFQTGLLNCVDEGNSL